MNKLGITFASLFLTIPLFGASCPNGGTLQQYINLSASNGGCDVGPNFILSNWAYVNVSVFSTPVTASDVIVSYSFNGSGVPQINFAANWLANVNLLTADGVGVLAFSLEARSETFKFSTVDLVATGSVSNPLLNLAGMPVPTGAATVTEVNCIGGLADLRDANNLLVITPPANLGDIACNGGLAKAGATATLAPGSNVNANALINLGPGDNFIDVIKIITVTDLVSLPVGGINGSAQITSISQNFAGADPGVPEPGAVLLTGLGLSALGVISRRRRREQEEAK